MPKWTVLEMLKNGRIDEYKNMVLKRGKDPKIVDKYWETYLKYREMQKKYDTEKHKFNVLQRERKIEELRELKNKIKEIERELSRLRNELISLSFSLPNIVLDVVPEGTSEEYNVPIKYVGKPKVWKEIEKAFQEMTKGKVEYEVIEKKPKGHADIIELLGCDTLQASQVAGSRFYYLFNEIVMLDFSLSLFALSKLYNKGFKLVIPPYMVRNYVIHAGLDIETFIDMIYKIENEDLYLIGTAEHSLLGLYMNRVIEQDGLPIKLAGWSPCFRKEAGSHGKDTKGIFRVHQFHKVEQFIFCEPSMEESMKYFYELVKNTEEIWREIGVPYRVVNMCAGELADHAAIKYDIECWYPAQGKYRELASISNCLDWQSHRGNVTVMDNKTRKRKYVYTLNGTAIPTTRAITAIIENFQNDDGTITIPRVLRKYMKLFGYDSDMIYPVKK